MGLAGRGMARLVARPVGARLGPARLGGDRQCVAGLGKAQGKAKAGLG